MSSYPARFRQAPPPLPVTGACKAAELAKLLSSRPRFEDIPECTAPAVRRVQVGLSVSADVCLWHSLRATEQLHAHLIRDLVST